MIIKYIKGIILGASLFITSFFPLWVYGQEGVCGEDLGDKVNLFVNNFSHDDPSLQKFCIFQDEASMPMMVFEETQKHLKRIATYDVGSTGIKFKLMDVDPDEKRIVNVIYSTKVPTKFEIREEDFCDRVAIMCGLKALVEKFFPHYNAIEHHGVATEGLRAVGEMGLRLAQEITDRGGIDFKVIDQSYEGLLGYYGVLAEEPSFNETKDIIWDIGGGSSQIVANEEDADSDKMKFLGVGVGGAKFNKIVLNLMHGEGAEFNKSLSQNPMSHEAINELSNMVKVWLTDEHGPFKPAVFKQEDIDFIKRKIANGSKVYGIGVIHNFVVKMYVESNIGSKAYYTKEDIGTILEMVADKTDDYIYDNIKKNKKDDPKFTKVDITALILVYAMMEELGIDKIYPVNISNTNGIAIKSIVDKNLEKMDKF